MQGMAAATFIAIGLAAYGIRQCIRAVMAEDLLQIGEYAVTGIVSLLGLTVILAQF